MKKFLLGYATCFIIVKYTPEIKKFLDGKIAKWELKQDILKHNNPDLG